MILEIDPRSAVPPYEQLREQITALVVGGALPSGARLPPIRQLAGDLGLAGGTIGRAYRELEADGVVAARGRHGTVVVGPPRAAAATSDDLLAAARRYADEASASGAGLDAALAAVRAAFLTGRTA